MAACTPDCIVSGTGPHECTHMNPAHVGVAYPMGSGRVGTSSVSLANMAESDSRLLVRLMSATCTDICVLSRSSCRESCTSGVIKIC